MGLVSPEIADAVRFAILTLIPVCTGLIVAVIRAMTRHFERLWWETNGRVDKIEMTTALLSALHLHDHTSETHEPPKQ